jgi:hypothetical protein
LYLYWPRTTFTIDLENIGFVRINYLVISFVEHASPDTPTPPSASAINNVQETLEDMFERDMHHRNLRAFWLVEDAKTINNQSVRAPVVGRHGIFPKNIVVNLEPGDKSSLTIGVYGTRYW